MHRLYLLLTLAINVVVMLIWPVFRERIRL
jgi:hypothetical protein